MKNKLILTLVIACVLLVAGNTFAAVKSIYGTVVYSGGGSPSSVTMTAGRIDSAGSTKATIRQVDFEYNSGTATYRIQLGTYDWWTNNQVIVSFSDGSGATGSINYTIQNFDPYEASGQVTLVQTPKSIDFTTVPSGLDVIIDGQTRTTPYTLNTHVGVQHTINAPTQIVGGDTRYSWSSWSDGDAQSHSFTVASGTADKVAYYNNVEYYLDVNSTHGNPQGEGWKAANSSAGFSVTNPDVSGTTRYQFTSWSGDKTSSNASETITMDGPKTVTAGWQTQYLLTTSVSPGAAGSVAKNPTAVGDWYDSGTDVQLTASNNSGYIFGDWSGSLSSTSNPVTVTMNAAKSITANFGTQVQIRVRTIPAGRTFYVEGTPYTSEQTFDWVSGQTKQVEIRTTTQSGASGTQYVYSNWSQGGAASQSYTVPASGTTLTANFTTQYELTMTSAHGNPTPAAGSTWHDANSQVAVSVTSPHVQGTTRYLLDTWSGARSDDATSFNLTMDGPKDLEAAWNTEYYLEVDSDHGNPQGEGWKAAGASASFSVTDPDLQGTTRHQFQNWSGDKSSTNASDNITMDGPKTVTASWQTQYYLTTAESPDAGGDISPAPPGAWYNAGANANLNATVNSGYEWAGWDGDLSGNTRPETLLMNAPKSVTANFNQVVQVTVNASIPGIEFVVDGNPYTTEQVFTWVVGSNHSLTATSIQTLGPTTYVWMSWSDGGARTHSYTVPSTNATVTANFVEKQDATLTMKRNVDSWGNTTPSPGAHVYSIGDVVNISATPAPGFRFKNWSSNVTNPGHQNTTVLIDNDKTVFAIFGKQDFTLTMASDPPQGGSTTPSSGEHTYNTYSLVELTAIPNPGWRFVEWVGNVDSNATEEQTTIRILQDESVTARFEEISYTLDISANPAEGGTTTPAAGSYEYGANEVVDLTATPGEGYRFVSWTGDVDDPTDPTTTISMTSNKVVAANFEPDQYTLTMVASPEGGGTTTPAVGDHIKAADEVVNISAVANEGYRFGNWTGGVADPEASTTTVTMDANKTITANFIRLGDVRVTTDPEGLRIIVDGQAYMSPQDFEWENGSTHSIAIDSTTQFRGPFAQHQYQAWSDGGAVSHQITVDNVLVYTAQFSTQYYLTTAVDPVEGGTITPAPPGGWYPANTKVPVDALADTLSGFRFTGWSGDLAGKSRPDTVTMTGPMAVTAEFAKLNTVVITTMPESLTVSVDGQKVNTPAEFMWATNSIHTITADTLKSGGVGVRHYFANWSDGKARSHAVTVNSDSTFTVNYLTQYYLSTAVEPEEGGQVTPEAPGAWYDSGTEVPLTAIANTEQDYLFVEWQGDLTSSENPTAVTMDSAISVTALFSTGDFYPPRVTYAFPGNGASNVPRNTPVQFKLRDDGAGINLATLTFKLNNVNILSNGIDQTGGHVAVNYKNKLCTVYYQPAVVLPADSIMTVMIQCEDSSPSPNMMDSTWTFHVGGVTTGHTKKDTVNTAGGVVYDDTTKITISIPANALKDTTEITISKVTTYPPLPDDANGLALGAHFGPAGLVFDDSVTISIPYDADVLADAGVTDPWDLVVYYYSTLNDAWITLKIVGVDENNVYVKVKEFCYLVYGVKSQSLAKPDKPDGLTSLYIDQYYGFATSSVVSAEGHGVQYRFDWGDGYRSFWSTDTTAAHKWSAVGDYGVVAFARSMVDTSIITVSDTLWITVVQDPTAVEEEIALPTVFKLDQNFPNPFNPETTIRFQVPKAAHVSIDVYNVNGQHIRTLVNQDHVAGYHSIVWNGQNDYGLQVSTGLYFVQMRAGDYVRTIKMSFLK